MVDTRFPRPVGDVGNARSFDFPLLYDLADGVTPTSMLDTTSSPVTSAVAAARRLLGRGVRAVATSCELLAEHQVTLAEGVGVPLMSSSLVQLPQVLRLLPASTSVLVLAFDSQALLGAPHLEQIGVAEADLDRVVVVGMEGAPLFRQMVLEQTHDLDAETIAAEVVAQLGPAFSSAASIGAVVLECTNLSPYSDVIRQTYDVPVWDVTTALRWLAAGFGEGSPTASR